MSQKKRQILGVIQIINLVVAMIAFSVLLSVPEVIGATGQTELQEAITMFESGQGTPAERGELLSWIRQQTSYSSTSQPVRIGLDTKNIQTSVGTDKWLKPKTDGFKELVRGENNYDATGYFKDTSGNEFWKRTTSTGKEEYYIKEPGKDIKTATGEQLVAAGIPIAGAVAPKVGFFGNEPWLGSLKFGGMGKVIFSNLLHAGVIAGVIYGVATMAGEDKDAAKAYAAGAAAGYLTFKIMKFLGEKKGVAWLGKNAFKGVLPVSWAGVASIGVGLIVTHILYKEESQKIVTFECYPWEAPRGGGDCEKCNSDDYSCTEYRCKSLGQACELLNAGTGEEKCAWVNPRDVKSPIIQTWKDALTDEHKYVKNTAIRPPDNGVKILRDKSECIKEFTPLSFGIILNEPAQCKVDYDRKDSYEEMAYYFGGSNIYKYNHTQVLSLPGPEAMNSESPELKNDGTYNLYVRCVDANNNANDDLFVFSFCVEKGPDVSPPIVESTSIANEMPVQYGLNETELEVYVNEPADCRWDKVDKDYENMANNMDCSQHVWEMNNQMLYKCKTTLTSLKDYEENMFYFRCKDQPYLGESVDRNTNMESYEFKLKGTQPLTIKEIKPEIDSTITGYSTLAVVNLEIETENGQNYGDSWCSYTTVEDASEDDYIQMFETGTNLHTQRLDLPAGDYTYYFQCVDLGGNAVYGETNFEVEIDAEAPQVVRAYQDAGKLKIITDEDSTCSYSIGEDKGCSFLIEEATNMPNADSTDHYADWQEGKTYYIKCRDANQRQPSTGCSIIVRAES